MSSASGLPSVSPCAAWAHPKTLRTPCCSWLRNMPPGLRGRCCRSPAHRWRKDKGGPLLPLSRPPMVPWSMDATAQMLAGYWREPPPRAAGSAHQRASAPQLRRPCLASTCYCWLLGLLNCSGRLCACKYDFAELGHFDLGLEDSMRVRFWGTRGSLPTPGPTTVRYGGNTSCLEITSSSNALIIIDCGTGIRLLGQDLVARQRTTLRGHILISHTHWDHIQGIPFFAPFFTPGNEWDLYAPKGVHRSLRDTLEGQMQYSYFPVQL